MGNSYWLKQEKKFFNAIKNAKIPNETLKNVDCVVLKNVDDLKLIPKGGGCYWIWTNEPICHSLHKNKLPPRFNGGEIIYNGIAKDNVKGRIRNHLFGVNDEGWSGISIDIYTRPSQSHRKKAYSQKGKVPYLNNNPIREKKSLLQLYLSKEEKEYIKKSGNEVYYFRNGIDITENKHKKYKFRVYYVIGLKSLYLDYIEKVWRKINGLPRLCSYSSGR